MPHPALSSTEITEPLGGASFPLPGLARHASPQMPARERPARVAAFARGELTFELRVSQLMTRYAAGDARAFDGLYALMKPRLGRLCGALVGQAERDDALQEVFLKLHRARATFLPEGNAVAWSYAVARTICADRLRLRARKVEIPIERERLEASAAAAHSGEERAVGAALQARLARLSECLRAAYVLVKVEGLSCAEAANLLGTTPSAVKQRVHRANAELRAELRAGESRPFVVRRNGDERCTNA